MCDASNPTGRRRGEISGVKILDPQKTNGSWREPKNDPTFPWKLTASETPKKVTEVWGLDGSDGWQILFPFGSDV